MNNEFVMNAARLLLSRGFSFCTYRFAGETQLNLATEETVIPPGSTTGFVVAPFVKASAAQEVELHKVNVITANWLQQLKALPSEEVAWAMLPQQTTREEYFERIGKFLEDMKAGKLQKAILSRVILMEKPFDFNSFDFFERLCSDYPQTFASLFYKPGEGIWMGATPETLLIKDGEVYTTMALAGTQPAKLSSQYTWRQKEMEEHKMVGGYIEEVFEKYHCEMIKRDGPKTIESGKVAHLRTDYQFIEKGENFMQPILNELHPTPAIGGLPVDKGVDCILKYEGYDRKYYCGYIGETNRKDLVRLFINLRCMQEGRDQIAIFAGGGITASSNPEEEWNETVQKSLTMLEKISPAAERK